MISEKYDVALSYASEQRDYVDQVYFSITKKGLTAFYDQVESFKLWGRDLAKYLQQIFLNNSKWCIMFISKDYVKKMWPNFEMEQIIARQMISGEYILPVRFDNTFVPGLNPNLHYQNAKKLTPSEIADIFENLFFERQKI